MFKVREAATGDRERLAELIAELGFQIDCDLVQSNLNALSAQCFTPLVADAGAVIGCITYNVMPVLHRPAPVGRISMLVVAGDWRGQGVGRSLVDAVTQRLLAGGCQLCEVTSNLSLVDAHAFYERLGFQRTSARFVRSI